MKGRLLENLSVNAIQLIVNQVLGLGIFYVLSVGLDKNTFGEINLVLAILLAAFNILSCGIDQLVVKKIAAGDDARSTLGLYLFHVLIAGVLFYGLLLFGHFFASRITVLYSLLLLIGAGKLMIFFSTPFKQAANGLERFKIMAWMLVVSNVIRCCGLIVLHFLHALTLHNIIVIFIAGDTAELLCCVLLFIFFIKVPVAIIWNPPAYLRLLREALPQTGVVLITSALARFDWIFIGILVSAAKLAEYSFAYKIFEISTLPLLTIAPLLIPRFTRIFQQDTVPIEELRFLAKAEMIIAAFTVLVINVCWSPVIDAITAGKYGAVNIKTIFILSLFLPLLYLNNFFWTIYFAQGRLKMILRSFVITIMVNVAGDILLIPFFKNEGAAIAYLAACAVQTIFYVKQSAAAELKAVWQPLLVSLSCAIAAMFVPKLLFHNYCITGVFSVILYCALLICSKQIGLADKKAVKAFLN